MIKIKIIDLIRLSDRKNISINDLDKIINGTINSNKYLSIQSKVEILEFRENIRKTCYDDITNGIKTMNKIMEKIREEVNAGILDPETEI